MIKIAGKIRKKFDTQTFGGFEKRVFWLEEVSEKYPNTYCLELWKDDCKMLDSYQENDYVTCSIDIKGKYWRKDDKEGVMNTLKCWNFEKEGKSYKEFSSPAKPKNFDPSDPANFEDDDDAF